MCCLFIHTLSNTDTSEHENYGIKTPEQQLEHSVNLKTNYSIQGSGSSVAVRFHNFSFS